MIQWLLKSWTFHGRKGDSWHPWYHMESPRWASGSPEGFQKSGNSLWQNHGLVCLVAVEYERGMRSDSTQQTWLLTRNRSHKKGNRPVLFPLYPPLSPQLFCFTNPVIYIDISTINYRIQLTKPTWPSFPELAEGNLQENPHIVSGQKI